MVKSGWLVNRAFVSAVSVVESRSSSDERMSNSPAWDGNVCKSLNADVGYTSRAPRGTEERTLMLVFTCMN